MANTPRPNPLLGALAMGATATDTARQKSLQEQQLKSQILTAGLSAIGEAGMRASLVPFNVAQARRMEGIQRLADQEADINMHAKISRANKDQVLNEFTGSVLRDYTKLGGIRTSAQEKMVHQVLSIEQSRMGIDKVKAARKHDIPELEALKESQIHKTETTKARLEELKDNLNLESFQSADAYTIVDPSDPTGNTNLQDDKGTDLSFSHANWYKYVQQQSVMLEHSKSSAILRQIDIRSRREQQVTDHEDRLFATKLGQAFMNIQIGGQQMNQFTESIKLARSRNSVVIRANTNMLRALDPVTGAIIDPELFQSSQALLLRNTPGGTAKDALDKNLKILMDTTGKYTDEEKVNAKSSIETYKEAIEKKDTRMQDNIAMITPGFGEGTPLEDMYKEFQEDFKTWDARDKIAFLSGNRTNLSTMRGASGGFKEAFFTLQGGPDAFGSRNKDIQGNIKLTPRAGILHSDEMLSPARSTVQKLTENIGNYGVDEDREKVPGSITGMTYPTVNFLRNMWTPARLNDQFYTQKLADMFHQRPGLTDRKNGVATDFAGHFLKEHASDQSRMADYATRLNAAATRVDEDGKLVFSDKDLAELAPAMLGQDIAEDILTDPQMRRAWSGELEDPNMTQLVSGALLSLYNTLYKGDQAAVEEEVTKIFELLQMSRQDC